MATCSRYLGSPPDKILFAEWLVEELRTFSLDLTPSRLTMIWKTPSYDELSLRRFCPNRQQFVSHQHLFVTVSNSLRMKLNKSFPCLKRVLHSDQCNLSRQGSGAIQHFTGEVEFMCAADIEDIPEHSTCISLRTKPNCPHAFSAVAAQNALPTDGKLD